VALAAAPFQPPRADPVVPDRPSASRSDPAARNRAEQQAAARAARELAQARAKAAKRAAQLAAAGQRARDIWEARGRPAKLAVIRRETVDLVTGGRLTRRVPRRGGDVTLATLDRSLPGSWLSITDGAARLSAAVVLTPGVTLDVGGEVTQLRLAGGATLPEAAAIYTGGGRLVLHRVTVTSANATFEGPMTAAAGRPFIVVSTGGRLEATNTTITDLGTDRTDPEDRPGVQFNNGSSGSLVRTALLRNSTGLQLIGSQDVRLDTVTVGESAGDGLILTDDRGTTMSGIRAVRNGGNGVRVSGTAADQPITGIIAAANGGFGIRAIRLEKAHITGISTSGNASGGLELNQADDVRVTDLATVDEPVGVFTHVSCSNIALDRLTISGGRRGVAIEKTTKHLTLQNSTIEHAKVAGIAIGGAEVELRDVSVRDSHTDVRVERGAEGVTAVGLRLSGGQDGLVAHSGTSRLVLHNLTAYGVENDAIRSSSPDARILGGSITGAATGITLGAGTTVTGTSISLVNDGMRIRSDRPVQAEDIDISAVAVGIDTMPGSRFLLSDSRVHALQAVRGDLTQDGSNELSLPPLNLLGAIGIPLMILALVLQHVHLVRQHRSGEHTDRWSPPAVPTTSVRRSLSRSAADNGPPGRLRRFRSRHRPTHDPVASG
jgi:hypothetical protein